MSKLIALIFILILSGCSTYKIVPDIGMSQLKNSAETISVAKVNKWPEGIHCNEPMLYVLTLGIIPTHCVDTYKVSTESQELGKVKVTSMQGWLTLMLVPFLTWQYGDGSGVEPEIKELMKVEK